MTLTKNDLKQIRTTLKVELNGRDKKLERRLEAVIENKLDENELRYEAKLTEFKSEFFERIDPILQEVKTSREERPLIENRLEVLEEKVGIHSS